MKIGLALSGGGSRGITHLGVIQALEEMKVSIDIISGTSAGAIAGAFYCSGMSPGQILEIYIKESFFKFAWPGFGKGGLLSTDKLKDFYNKYLPARSFDELNMPLVVSATDLVHGKTVRFTQGDLIEAILASSSVPIVFNPIELRGMKLVDGGLLDNLPVTPIRDQCQHVIGVHANPNADHMEITSIMSMIERSLSLALSVNAHQSMKLCDVAIEPKDLDQFGTTDINKAREIYEIGYVETYRHKDAIMRLLD